MKIKLSIYLSIYALVVHVLQFLCRDLIMSEWTTENNSSLPVTLWVKMSRHNDVLTYIYLENIKCDVNIYKDVLYPY